MRTGRRGFDPFQLESLEPRVLLSAAPVDAPQAASSASHVDDCSEVASVSFQESNPFSGPTSEHGMADLLAQTGPLPSLEETSEGVPNSDSAGPVTEFSLAHESNLEPSPDDSSANGIENTKPDSLPSPTLTSPQTPSEPGQALPSNPSPISDILVTTLRTGNGPPLTTDTLRALDSESARKLALHSIPEPALADPFDSFRHLQLAATSSGGSLTSNQTWNGTIHVTSNLFIPADVTLTLDPGTVLKVGPGVILQVQGSLLARGTPAQPIFIVSANDDSVGEDVSGPGTATPSPGDWESLIFVAGSSGSILENVELRHAGMSSPGNRDYRDAMLIQSSSVSLRDVRLRDSASTGIRVTGPIAPTLDGVDVQRSGNFAFYFTSDAKPVLNRLSSGNNKTEGLWIDGGIILDHQAWTYVGLPYHFTTDVTLAAERTLDLGPGTIFRMPAGAIFVVTGTLRVNGTAAAPVILTARTDDTAGGDSDHDGSEDAAAPAAGDWEQIYFATTSGASVVNHLDVRYAGMSAPPQSGLSRCRADPSRRHPPRCACP